MSRVVNNKECGSSGQSGMVILRRVRRAKFQTRDEVTLHFLFVSIYLTEGVQLKNRLINTSPCFPRCEGTQYHRNMCTAVCVWREYGVQADSQVTLPLCSKNVNVQFL